MKSSEFINWDNLKNIPFAECQVVEDKENKDIDIYYRGEMVFTDYDHVGHYLRNAIALFQTIRRKNADWVNLANLWLLRNCIRENYNHGIGIEDMIFGNDVDTLQPMTKQRLFAAAKEIQRRDKYATL